MPGHKPHKLNNGYARVYVPGHPMAHSNGMEQAHRVVAYDAGWEIPEGYQIHHKNGIKDDNRLENLEVVAIDEHARIHARQTTPTHCPQNHLYDEANTGINPSGWRYCRTCNRERARRRAQALRDA